MKEIKTYLLPPPNLTGKLHIGHCYCFHASCINALMMNGSVIWGADHAGISAQVRVDPSRSLSGQALMESMKGLCIENWHQFLLSYRSWGIKPNGPCAFSLCKQFRETSFRVYHSLLSKGFIVKREGMVNIESNQGRIISDAEIQQLDTTEIMYYIRYDLHDNEGHVLVATTRPETCPADTMLGCRRDHPEYAHLIGRVFRCPITNQSLILHEIEDISNEFGTGVVKITPRYDEKDLQRALKLTFNDMGIRIWDTSMKCLLDDYVGLGYEDYKNAFIMDLKSGGFVIKEEKIDCKRPFFRYNLDGKQIKIKVFHDYRDGIFLRLGELAKKHFKSVVKTFTRPQWALHDVEAWLKRCGDWCISREIEWGQYIPGEEGLVFDTWFNAALWPIVFAGNGSTALNYLITGHDLIFFWYIKMQLICLEELDKPAFQRVFFHGLVRDIHGRKMSKSLGNIIDPNEEISKVGRDLFRLSICRNITFNKDIKHDISFEAKKIYNKLYSLHKLCVSKASNINISRTVHPYGVIKSNIFERDMLEAMSNFQYRDCFEMLYRHAFMISRPWLCDFFGNCMTIPYMIDRIIRLIRPITPDLFYRHSLIELGKLEIVPYQEDMWSEIQGSLCLAIYLKMLHYKVIISLKNPTILEIEDNVLEMTA